MEEEFRWRDNSLKEKREMRKKRNQRKKAKQKVLKDKSKKIQEVKERDKLEAAKAQARRYKEHAKKHRNKKSETRKRINHQTVSDVKGESLKAKIIDRKNIVEADGVLESAKGSFGKCLLKMYQGHLVVTKEFRKGVSKADVIKEATILRNLSHPGLPVILGIDLTDLPFIMVSLFYGIDQSNTTLYCLLTSTRNKFAPLEKSESIAIIQQLSEALKYLHDHNILHNDIKSDNVMIYKDIAGRKPVLVDFGKACAIEEGEYRTIPAENRSRYRKRHSHISPEIVEGIAPQSTASDVFSLGRIVYRIGNLHNCKKILELSHSCTSENMATRCSISYVIDECDILNRI